SRSRGLFLFSGEVPASRERSRAEPASSCGYGRIGGSARAAAGFAHHGPLGPPPRKASPYAPASVVPSGKRLTAKPTAKPSGPHPIQARLADPRDLVVAEEPDPPADHPEEAAGHEDPGLRLGIAIRVERALRLATADRVDEEVVHLAHMRTQVILQLGILRR